MQDSFLYLYFYKGIIMILFIGTTELIIIFLVFLLLFGSKKIPELARSLGRGVREFQKAADDIKQHISEVESNEVNNPKITDEKNKEK